VDGVIEQVTPPAQPASAIFGIKVITGLIPGIAMLLGAIILIWFPMRGAIGKGAARSAGTGRQKTRPTGTYLNLTGLSIILMANFLLLLVFTVLPQ